MSTKTRDKKLTHLRIVQKHELARDGGGGPPSIIDDGDGGDDDGDDDDDYDGYDEREVDDCPEIEGYELRVGDVIRCRPYRGIPGMPRFCAQGDDVEFTIGRIESTRLGGNQRYQITLVLWAVELHEVLYVRDKDIVNLVRRERQQVVGPTVVHAIARVLPEVRRLPAPRKELPPG